MKKIYLFLAIGLALFLPACTPTSANLAPDVPATVIQPTGYPATETIPASFPTASESLTRIDQQGSVTVAVTPLNFEQPGQTLDFQVSLETHSVDLSLDLATVATLTTDTGLVVQALSWGGPKGGHHVSGTLSFPSTQDGKPVMEGAKKLTLTIKDLDDPERVFIWDLP